jgi:hypothetical protein
MSGHAQPQRDGTRHRDELSIGDGHEMNHLQFGCPAAITAWPRARAKARFRAPRSALRLAGRPSSLGGVDERADRRRAPEG